MYVELPEVGSKVEKSSSFGVVESVKAASDVYSPVSGEVIEVNESLADTPGAVNEAAFSDGWLMKVRMSDKSELDSMMDAKEYEASWYASFRLGSTRLETRPRSSLDFHFARRPLTGFDRRRFARQPINARARTLQTIHSTSSYDPLLCLILSSSINPSSVFAIVSEVRARAFAHSLSPHTSTRRERRAGARARASVPNETMRETDGDEPSPSRARRRDRRQRDDDDADTATDRASTSSQRGNFFIASTSEGAGDARGGASRAGYRIGPELYATKNRARTHRCNDRLEDVVQALFEGNPLLAVPPAWSLFVKCMRSEIGDEPRDPFLYHTPKWLEEQRAREKANKGRGWFGKS